MQKALISLAMCILALCAGARQYSVESLPNVQKQDRTRHLVNPDGIVSAATGARIDSLLLDIRRVSSSEAVAVIVDDIDTDDIDSYATELFNTWGIGKSDKNNGILILVAKDRRRAVIRTGYGAEGVLPDIISGRILRNEMFPRFREGDYEGGLLAGVEAVHKYVTDPEAAAELHSDEKDNYGSGSTGLLGLYLWTAVAVAVLLMLFVICVCARQATDKGKTDYQKYVDTDRYILPVLIVSLLFVGIPILAWVALWLMRRHWRDHGRKCRRCGTAMVKQSEERDNDYLSYAQDLEEKINSVDYDVWVCPKCGETDIYSFVNRRSEYTQCEVCHARTKKLSGVRILREPTTRAEGVGVKEYVCLNCNHRSSEQYRLPRKETPPVVIIPGGGGGGFRGGGGSLGGGFGGGLTGGGGASGGW